MNTNQAIRMIQDHGHKAFATADGLLAIGEVNWSHPNNPAWPACKETGTDEVFNHGMIIAGEYVRFTDDVWFEESTVFEMRDDGSIDSAAIRRWLGY